MKTGYLVIGIWYLVLILCILTNLLLPCADKQIKSFAANCANEDWALWEDHTVQQKCEYYSTDQRNQRKSAVNVFTDEFRDTAKGSKPKPSTKYQLPCSCKHRIEILRRPRPYLFFAEAM